MRQLVLVINNIRSCHNVGAMLRSAEGLGVKEVILTGYTPYPRQADDKRLPHIADKATRQIAKTALGAEKMPGVSHQPSLAGCLGRLKKLEFTIAAIEQADNSTKLPDFEPPEKLAIIMGNEVDGLSSQELALADITLEIPMFGTKESYNVAASAAMTLYHCRFFGKEA